MSHLSLCKHEICEKSQVCKRFLDTPNYQGQYIKFQNICDKENDYFFYIQADESLIKRGGEEK